MWSTNHWQKLIKNINDGFKKLWACSVWSTILSGHETRFLSQALWSLGTLSNHNYETQISVSGHETRCPAKIGSAYQDMKPGPQRLPNRGKSVLRIRTWNPVHRDSQIRQNLFSVLEYETQSTGTPKSGKAVPRTWNPVHRDSQILLTQVSMPGHETRSTGTPKSC